MRRGHWAVVDLIGKGGVRTVPIPAWVKAALDQWTRAAGVTEGRIFRSCRQDERRGAKASRRMLCGMWSRLAAKEQTWSISHRTICEAMPNSGICRTEILKHSGNRRESWGYSVVLLGSMRHSPVRFTSRGESSALTMKLFYVSLSSDERHRRSSQLPRQAALQAGQECCGDAHLRGISLVDLFRYFDLRLRRLPDYAESLGCEKAHAAAVVRPFVIFQNSA